MHIRKGDNVIIITGKDKGKVGKVTRVFPKKSAVIIDGVNVKKRHQKSRKSREKGQILDIAAPIDASNVMLVDPKTGGRTRVTYKKEGKKEGKKVVRIAKKSGIRI